MKKNIIFLLLLLLNITIVFASNTLEVGIPTCTPMIFDMDDDGVNEIIISVVDPTGASKRINFIELNGEEFNDEIKQLIIPEGTVLNNINYYVDAEKKYLLFGGNKDGTSKCKIFSYTTTGDFNWEKEYNFQYLKAPIADYETEQIYVSLMKPGAGADGGEMSVLDYSGNEVWSKSYTSGISSNAVIEDINVDGEKELIYHTNDGLLEVLDSTFSPLKGFPKKLPRNPSDSFYDFAVKDINGNRYKEIIVSSGFTSYQYFFVFDYKGNKIGEIRVNQKCRDIPEVYDFDNDGTKEVIITSVDGKIFVKDLKGKDVSPWPVQAGSGEMLDSGGNKIRKIVGNPVLLDTDGDGKPEIIVVALDQTEHKLKVYDLKGNIVDDSISLGLLNNAPTAKFYSIADLDMDTNLDLVFIDSSGSGELKVEHIEAPNKTIINEVHRTIEYK
ncbi:MAG: hypothetical protein C0601_02135 [Candidatus Muiribacterium halophilum]|uniref:VCBS repeat-containing protein n=1 Tax=Muiribacterium halophilum TaxID=2053465 RepID=A0A2N5ZL55_MUIH1|nr:MAG: hypothetical protein C0601_02135 [Candidatus Muirbacterium halophilum]